MCAFTDLIGLIHHCSTPNPTTVLLDGVWDFKQWLEPYMAVVEQHSWYHCYRFTRNSAGISEMHYKQYSGQPWLPDKDGIQLPGDQILIVCVCKRRCKIELRILKDCVDTEVLYATVYK